MGNLEKAKESLQNVADHSTTEAVELGLKTTTEVILDPAKGDQGFSYLAKRAYTEAGYPPKQALKAAMLLSIKFIDATGDSELKVHKNDKLRIESSRAILNIKGEEFIVEFEEAALQQQRDVSRERTTREATQARQEILTDFSVPYAETANARERLGLEGAEMFLTTAITETHPGYPGYKFRRLSFGVGPNVTTWLVGASPKPQYVSESFIVIDTNGKKLGSSSNEQGLDRLLRVLVEEIKNPTETPEPPEHPLPPEQSAAPEPSVIPEVEISAAEDELRTKPREARNVLGWGPQSSNPLVEIISRRAIDHAGSGVITTDYINLQPNGRRVNLTTYYKRTFGVEVQKVHLTNNKGGSREFLVVYQPKNDTFKITPSFTDPAPKFTSRDQFLATLDSYLV